MKKHTHHTMLKAGAAIRWFKIMADYGRSFGRPLTIITVIKALAAMIFGFFAAHVERHRHVYFSH